jgi:hypothetical protein
MTPEQKVVDILTAIDRGFGGDGVYTPSPDFHAIQVGPRSYVAFDGEHFAVVLHPEERHYTRRAVRLIGERLKTYPKISSQVHHLNVLSIIGTRKLGATLVTTDADGYLFYELTREGFRYGKAKSTTAAEPAADQ